MFQIVHTVTTQKLSPEIQPMIVCESSILTPVEWQFLTKEWNLSTRQLQILQGLFRGMSDKAISTQLAISPHYIPHSFTASL